MGHIVHKNEIKRVESNNSHRLSAAVYSDSKHTNVPRLSWSCNGPASVPRPNYSLRPKSPSRGARYQLYPGLFPRPFVTYFGCTWKDCVQGVANILPSSYADRWLRCLEQLMHCEGPLPEAWRIYIAIMALVRHEVTWVVRALAFEFISSEGDRKWLSGVRFAPKKLQSLTPINKILAHRPWELTSQHILDLTKGEESWSISELCQALCLMTHFHAFASFLHSCMPHPPTSVSSSHYLPSAPVSLPISPINSPAKALLQLPSSLPDKLREPKTDKVAAATKVHSEDNLNDSSKVNLQKTVLSGNPSGPASVVAPVSISSPSSPVKSNSLHSDGGAKSGPVSLPISISEQRPLKDNSSVPSEETATVKPKLSVSSASNGVLPMGSTTAGAKREIQASPQPSKQSKNDALRSSRSFGWREESPSCLREFLHLCSDLSFSYVDFPSGASDAILKVRDFNWQEHGYSIMTRLLNEMSNLIDERFGAAKSLCHPAWVTNDDGAYHYRRAVYNYVQSLFGIHHDDYVYSHIDTHLNPAVKSFIKRVCCRPETLEGDIPQCLVTPTPDGGDTTHLRPSTTTETRPTPDIADSAQLIPLSVMVMEARIETELLYALKAIIPHQR